MHPIRKRSKLGTSCGIGVEGLDRLYEEFKGVAARVGPLEVKAWGRREFHMIVPSGVCLQFFEAPPAAGT